MTAMDGSGLASRLAVNDSIQELDAARADRYWDAVALAVEGRAFAACYLLGYAIEMSLKVALFRLKGVPLTANVQTELIAARQMVRARGFRNLHDLGFWVESLIEERNLRGVPMDRASEHSLRLRVYDAAMNWRETMRYRRSVDAQGEANELTGTCDWIAERLSQLWSISHAGS